MCQNCDLSEEITQETFFRAFKSFDKYKGESSINTWLISIAKYTYFSYMRKNKLYLDSIPLDDIVNHFCSNKSNLIGAEFEKKEIICAMKIMVKELPDKYKEVVLLRILGELSFKDVAISMNISESSAKVLYFRAKNQLKECLNHEFKL